jgi:hypothetical protein
VNLTGLDEQSHNGHYLLDMSEPVAAHSAFERWVSSVAGWLAKVAPDTGLSSNWRSLSYSYLVVGGCYSNETSEWENYRSAVRERLGWLGQLPARAKALHTAIPSKAQAVTREQEPNDVSLPTKSRPYVQPERIVELKHIKHAEFDLVKLIRICEELNICSASECNFAVAMLTRALIDHVPPIFGCGTFAELSNSYAGGSKSFKESMQNLGNSSRKIADQQLHCQIRRSESLPTARQVDFGNDVDVLLGEVARVLRKV